MRRNAVTSRDGPGTIAIILGILVLVPLFVLSNGMPANTQKLLALTGAIGLLLVCEAFCLLRHRQETVRIPWLAFAIAPLSIAALISMIHASNRCFVLLSLLAVLLGALYAVLLSHRVRGRREMRWVLAASLCAGVVASLIAIVQYLGWSGDPNASALARITSTFGNRNYLGGFLGCWVFPTVVLYLRTQHRIGRFLVAAGLSVCLFALLLVQQTGIALALLPGLLYIAVGLLVFRLRRALARSARQIVFLAVPALIVVGAGLALWSLHPHGQPNPQAESAVARLWSSNSGGVREVNWWTAWQMASENPWTGVGLGNYKVDYLSYKAQFLRSTEEDAYSRPMERAAQAHNDILQALAELGAPGGIALVIALALGALTVVKKMSTSISEEHKLDLLLVSAGIVVVLVHALVSFPFHLPASALALLTLIGLMSSRPFGPAASGRIAFNVRGLKGLAALWLVLGALLIVGSAREWIAQQAVVDGERLLLRDACADAASRFDTSVALSLCASEARFLTAYAHACNADASAFTGDAAAEAEHLTAAHQEAVAALPFWYTEETMLLIAATALRLGDPDEAEPTVERLLDTRPLRRHEREALYLLASIALERGDVATAEKRLRGIIATYPEFPPAYVLLARILAASDRRQAALETLETAAWEIVAALDELGQQMLVAEQDDVEELVWEKRRLLVGQEQVLRDFEQLAGP